MEVEWNTIAIWHLHRQMSLRLTRRLAPLLSRRRFVVYLFDLRSQPLPDLTPALKVRFSTDADCVFECLRATPNEYEMERRDLASFQRRLSEGEICFSAWVENKLAFHGWIQFRCRKPAPWTQIPISTGSAFIHRCATHAAFRGQKIYPSALAFALRELKGKGIERVFIDHAVENVSSRRGIERVGATPVGNYTLFSFCFVRWARFEPRVRAAISGHADSPRFPQLPTPQPVRQCCGAHE